MNDWFDSPVSKNNLVYAVPPKILHLRFRVDARPDDLKIVGRPVVTVRLDHAHPLHHAHPVRDAAKDGVLTVEPRGGRQCNKAAAASSAPPRAHFGMTCTYN